MKNFELHRIVDETGISGTGIIAEGVIFSDGTCALRWKTAAKSTAVYDDLATLVQIHGHQGKTKVIYVGDAYGRGTQDAAQDRIENVPFASVGGPSRRASMVAPDYITPAEHESYLCGYQGGATAVYGAGWKDDPAWDSPPVAVPSPKDGDR